MTDDVHSILDVATSVLEDYGVDDRTRIARMALWIVENLVHENVEEVHTGELSRIKVPGFAEVIRAGDKLAIAGRTITAKDACAVAYALLAAAGKVVDLECTECREPFARNVKP